MRPGRILGCVLVIVLMVLVIKSLLPTTRVIHELQTEVKMTEVRDYNRLSRSSINLDVLDLQLPAKDDFKCVQMKVTDIISAPICVYEAKEDKLVSGSLLQGHLWQGSNINIFCSLANEDPELNLIDLGANLGTWTIIAAALGKQVVAVEPFPPTISRLHRSLQLGHLESRVTLVTNPLSDKYEDVVFHEEKGNKGGVAIRSKNSSGELLDHTTVKKTTTLNDLASIIPGGFNKAFMKMDIEDMELKALNASDVLFSVVDIPLITIEWLFHKKKMDRPEVRYFETWFTRMGYFPCYIQGGSSGLLDFHLLGSTALDRKWRDINDIFLVRKDFFKEIKRVVRIV